MPTSTDSPNLPFFTEKERQMLLDHPIDYTASNKDILRLLIEDIINAYDERASSEHRLSQHKGAGTNDCLMAIPLARPNN